MSLEHTHKWAPWGLGIGLVVAAVAAALWGGRALSRPAYAASPVYVRTDGDDTLCNGAYDAPATTAPNCAFATVGQAVHAVDSGGTVIVAAGTYTEIVVIDRSLSLQGAGADQTVIDGGGSGSVIANGPGQAVTISGVTLRRGVADQGGGVHNRGALTLVDSVVFSNTATVAGGGIYNDAGGALALSNSTVISNTALALGFGGGGGIYNSSGSVVISHCGIVGNTTLAHGVWGGGGGIRNSNGSLTVHNSVVSLNNAHDSGGGIISSGGTLDIFDSLISDNVAQDDDAYGGGIFSSSPASLTNVTVSGNIVKALSGGIHSQHAMTLTNVTVSGNTAGNGGGVLHTGSEDTTMTVINATITDNKVTGSGHGIAGGLQAYAPVAFLNTIVADNENANCCCSTLNLISQGHNLDDENTCNFSASTDFVDTDPVLRPLGDNGGPAVGQGQALFTHALPPGSPAIDAGANEGCPMTDQRGLARPMDGDLNGIATCDIGAYEFEPKRVFLPLTVRQFQGLGALPGTRASAPE